MSYAYDIFGIGNSFTGESRDNIFFQKKLNTVKIMAGSTNIFSGINNNPLSFGFEPEWEALGEFLPVSDFVKLLAGGTNTSEIGLFSTMWMKGNSYLTFDIESRVFTEYRSSDKKELEDKDKIINSIAYVLNLSQAASKSQISSVSYAVNQIIKGYTKQFDALITAGKSTLGDLKSLGTNLMEGNFSGVLNNAISAVKDFIDSYWNTLLSGFKGKTLSLVYYPTNSSSGFKINDVIIKSVNFTFSQDFVLLEASKKKNDTNVNVVAAPRYIDFKITLQTLSHANVSRIGGIGNMIITAKTQSSTVSSPYDDTVSLFNPAIAELESVTGKGVSNILTSLDISTIAKAAPSAAKPTPSANSQASAIGVTNKKNKPETAQQKAARLEAEKNNSAAKKWAKDFADSADPEKLDDQQNFNKVIKIPDEIEVK